MNIPVSASGSRSTRTVALGPFAAPWTVGIITVGAIAIYTALRLQGLSEFSLWGGESFLVVGARMGWRSMLTYIAEDLVHPPLAYVLLKTWIAVGGESIVWLKLFPVLTAVGTIVPLLLLLRELRMSLFEINLVLILAALNAFLIHYAQEVRMYSLLLFFAMCSAWLFVRYCNREGTAGRDLAYLTAANVLLVHTHTYGWLVLSVEGLAILAMHRRRLARFSASVLTVILLFLPWAFLAGRELADRGSPFGFIPPTTVRQVVHLYTTFNGRLELWGTIRPGLILFALPLAWWSVRVLLGRTEPNEKRLFKWLALFSFVPVFMVIPAGWLLNDSFWWDRYFIFVAPFYLALVAASIYRLRPKALRTAYAGLLVVSAGAASFSDLSTERVAWVSPQVGSRVDWEGAARELVATTPPGADSVKVYIIPVWSVNDVTGQWAIRRSIPFYMEPEDRDRLAFATVFNYDQLLGESLGPDFWIATFEIEGVPRRLPEDEFREMGYVVTQFLRFGKPGRAFLLSRVVRGDALPLEPAWGSSSSNNLQETSIQQ